MTFDDAILHDADCGNSRPGNLSDPTAAAENAMGCEDCGQPWWTHRLRGEIALRDQLAKEGYTSLGALAPLGTIPYEEGK